jgi:hypothetical protein
MRPMDAQNRLPEVATDQFALDRTLKHLRKLRWIGRENEARKFSPFSTSEGDGSRRPDDSARTIVC